MQHSVVQICRRGPAWHLANQILFALLLTTVLAPGCAVTKQKNLMVDGEKLDEEMSNANDDWAAKAGRQIRGGRGVIKENDPLKRFIMSEESLQIERNLGIE